ncbi:hypothetical protein JJ672_14315 [Klebsiella pneumoniae]|uniref:hypothetical protein n=1 Tax=Klebsiella pneumoniae TaxID=573 RepID=UPI000A3D89AF|nr:hypothetical protein [Klebsiella pneumoniae]ARS97926.1 hypothetical protein B8O09_01530 [Klebsiella pneumoniae]UMD21218.1 hypothetical protein JJ672_14315 [Klebsiella pneumoniae]HBT9225403.1 hypothetical protein [Klebsiella pneumoniae]HBT9352313.1 hypothetical protein [Klebsiella pneumoniae]HBU3899633.1 hypothetical protein [Klebsiella pneumoniae]
MKTQNFLVSLDIAVRMFVEPDGKLVIETDYLGDIDVRQGPVRSVSEESLRITGGCRLPSDESLRNHTINC